MSDVVQRVVSAQVEYIDETGEARSIGIKIRALEEADDAAVARIGANLAGVPYAHLDDGARAIFASAARVAVATDNVEELPGWLKANWPHSLLKHPTLAIQLGVFIGGHTERYFRGLRAARGVDASAAAVQVRITPRPSGN